MEWLALFLKEHGVEIECVHCSLTNNIFQDDISSSKRKIHGRNHKIRKAPKEQSDYRTPV